MTDSKPTITIEPVSTSDDLAAAKALFLAYAQSLDFSLCFQGFDEELAGMPGKYDPTQNGALLLGKVDGVARGVVGLRDLGDGVAEMKRLYVDPEGRGHNLGRLLADAVIAEARRLGYRLMRLDTLRRMVAANRIYDALEFRDIPPYYDNPMDDVRYRELKL
ncbi:GNAT family N-acetyltransferase [Ferrovibrio sp.]|uniref:GNAT family N-acetyltransferase n=1 Tax=Ferrovibrio sp. TaxID=1917215 RepID=UPI0035B21314